ncbi:hypothetical protein AVEN_150272-1 [Araneus ventricosus]|uniref:Secreted protein n=1 Tax=Araneus ventricosus TaxID=182803 RepID=A0A4Y2HCY0_ARAVE|nr:hypothetical protein AVEN_150272-1 [Araneus ventricosus]
MKTFLLCFLALALVSYCYGFVISVLCWREQEGNVICNHTFDATKNQGTISLPPQYNRQTKLYATAYSGNGGNGYYSPPVPPPL